MLVKQALHVYLALWIFCVRDLRGAGWWRGVLHPTEAVLEWFWEPFRAYPQCHLQKVLRTGWRRRVESSVTFHLLSSCSKCHFKSGERCSLDWVASHHTCQLAETGRLWLGDEAMLGCWTPACLRPVNVAWNIRGKPLCLTVTGCHAYGICYSVVAFCLSALLFVLKAQSAEL